jgi:hypothetical protein
MSLVTTCDLQNLTIDDIFRLVSACDADGNFYIRVVPYDGEEELNDCVECDGKNITALNILKFALCTNADGKYALQVVNVED